MSEFRRKGVTMPTIGTPLTQAQQDLRRGPLRGITVAKSIVPESVGEETSLF